MVQPYMNDTDTLEKWKYLLKIYRYIDRDILRAISSTHCYIPKRNESLCQPKVMYKNMLSNFTHNSPKLETSNVHQWNNGSIVLYLHIGISRRNEKE